MGLGDDLMATGFAYRLHQETGRSVVIGRRPAAPAKSVIYENIPWLSTQPNPNAAFYKSAEGCRPYIDYQHSRRGRQVLYRDGYSPIPGRLYFSDKERAAADALMGDGTPIVVEPHVKGTFSGQNKAWPWDHWQVLVGMLLDAGEEVVQLSKPGSRILEGVRPVCSESVRVALCCIRRGKALVATDGLQHHSAAAQGVRAVVLWGARTNPRILGYDLHENLTSGSDWCGSMSECGHCREAMAAITPGDVLEALYDRVLA